MSLMAPIKTSRTIKTLLKVPRTMKVLTAATLFSTFLVAWVLVHATLEFTNLKCNALDKPFADFEYCFLKAVNRSYKYISVKVKLFKIPITNITVTIAVLKRANGFKPFLYNFTFDACKFFRSDRNNKLIQFFYGPFERYSNMNHTCPFAHDLLLEKLPTSHLKYMSEELLPWPEGEYQVHTLFRAYNVPRASFQLQFLKT